MVNLEARDYLLIRQVAQEKGLGKKGFSAALRLIVREWAHLNALVNQDDFYPYQPDDYDW
jgi:hypothetical protein